MSSDTPNRRQLYQLVNADLSHGPCVVNGRYMNEEEAERENEEWAGTDEPLIWIKAMLPANNNPFKLGNLVTYKYKEIEGLMVVRNSYNKSA